MIFPADFFPTSQLPLHLYAVRCLEAGCCHLVRGLLGKSLLLPPHIIVRSHPLCWQCVALYIVHCIKILSEIRKNTPQIIQWNLFKSQSCIQDYFTELEICDAVNQTVKTQHWCLKWSHRKDSINSSLSNILGLCFVRSKAAQTQSYSLLTIFK